VEMCKQHTIKLSRRISIETQSLWRKKLGFPARALLTQKCSGVVSNLLWWLPTEKCTNFPAINCEKSVHKRWKLSLKCRF
jgi:hypothetical protein